MAQEDYKEFSCKSIGMTCGFQVRARTEEEIMEHAKMHASKAHGMKEIPTDVETKIKANSELLSRYPDSRPDSSDEVGRPKVRSFLLFLHDRGSSPSGILARFAGIFGTTFIQ